MFAPRYDFRSRWSVDAPPAAVYTALFRVVDYPIWWPEFREVTPVGETPKGMPRHRMVVRSFLPYRITYILTQVIADRATGKLEATVDGDIAGRIGWKIDPTDAGTRVRFRESVQTRVELLNLLAPIARCAFELNHQLMMRDGLVGLRAYLAGRAPRPVAPHVRRPGESYR